MAPGGRRERLIGGPGIVLVWLYGVMVVGAVSRSAFQIATDFGRAPLAYALSAVAGLVYGFITYTLVRGGETARRAALVCCVAELVGVVTVGTWTLVDPSAFPDSTVWSDFGVGYLFIPVLLPVSALYWLRGRAPRAGRAAA
ncbi:integral membrane protein [Streptomyces zinciresistens K42]|uniref:Integral membrane protein n=1 Tax=Streptomyces zinciresistens K42 TaxID=700597 RepID=G2GMC3_9ACTN|nr:integral membrane protein [Streptomyces zinciresistens K42]